MIACAEDHSHHIGIPRGCFDEIQDTLSSLGMPDSGIGRATLALRDYLRDHPAERDAYAIEKRRLASLHVGDTADRREAYASAKSPFLDPLIARALQLGYPRV